MGKSWAPKHLFLGAQPKIEGHWATEPLLVFFPALHPRVSNIQLWLSPQFMGTSTKQWKKCIAQDTTFVCLFCCFTSQVNIYGHGGTVSSPNHTFSWASLKKQLKSTLCTYFCLLLKKTLLEWFSGREENDRENYFMINLHESMGPGSNSRPLDLQSDSHLLSDTLLTVLRGTVKTQLRDTLGGEIRTVATLWSLV